MELYNKNVNKVLNNVIKLSSLVVLHSYIPILPIHYAVFNKIENL